MEMDFNSLEIKIKDSESSFVVVWGGYIAQENNGSRTAVIPVTKNGLSHLMSRIQKHIERTGEIN